ncbi:MAG TPA: AAA family ATPase [Tepidisphaeraceae bacterium]|nr:AAA family ATPase [Tepidisphaeraceae bacterium]
MYVQLNAAIVDPDAANRQELATFLSGFGINVVAQYAQTEQVAGALGRVDSPQLVIINLDPAPAETLKRLGQLPRQHPGTSFFVLSQTLDPNVLMEAMHMGVREFIPVPIQEQKFSASIERIASQHGMGKKARIVHVIPTIGGCGSTTVSCNVAASLAQAGSKTVLADLDLVRGGAASYFDVRPRYTIADVMASAEKVDKQLLDNALCVHRTSQLSILARPELPEDTQRVTQAGLQRLLNVVGRMYDWVVLDSVMSIDPVYSAALQAADLNLIVMQLNVPSCRNAERFVGAMRRMGIDASKIKIVVNRFVKKGGDIEPDEVEKALGMKISWLIPNDFKNAIAAINFGEPVVLRSPRSEMSVSLQQLANSLLPADAVRKAA